MEVKRLSDKTVTMEFTLAELVAIRDAATVGDLSEPAVVDLDRFTRVVCGEGEYAAGRN